MRTEHTDTVPARTASEKGRLDQLLLSEGATRAPIIEGNFCRCTGYTKIIESVKVAAEKVRG